MVSMEEIVLEKLVAFKQSESDKCLSEILVLLRKWLYKLDYKILEEEINLRGLRDGWQIVKEIVFTSKINY